MAQFKDDNGLVHTVNESIILAKNMVVLIAVHVMLIKELASEALVILEVTRQLFLIKYPLGVAQAFLVIVVVRGVVLAVVVLVANNITTQGLKQWKI